MPRKSSTAFDEGEHRPHGPAYLGQALEFEQVARHRHLACGLYCVCLEVAVRRRWSSFTCQHCSLWPEAAAGRLARRGPAQVLFLPGAARD